MKKMFIFISLFSVFNISARLIEPLLVPTQPQGARVVTLREWRAATQGMDRHTQDAIVRAQQAQAQQLKRAVEAKHHSKRFPETRELFPAVILDLHKNNTTGRCSQAQARALLRLFGNQ